MGGREVLVISDNGPRRVWLRPCTAVDVDALVEVWAPILEIGPRSWLDRDWMWETLDAADQVAFDASPACLVLADEVEEGAPRDLLGVLVTTGPITPSRAKLDTASVGEGGIVWVEYVAIAPGLRPHCPAQHRRAGGLKGVGTQLMIAAIRRSEELGCEGRVGLHAEGEDSRRKYQDWGMEELAEAPHPAGGRFPVFFGSAAWARGFMERRRVPA